MPASLVKSLLSQFQARYPMGCLSAELLTIHQEQYVIRAVIQMGSLTLATAMATDSNLETAEDRAKLRVLEAVILEPVLTSAPPVASDQPIDQRNVKLEPAFTEPLQPLPVDSLPTLPQPVFSTTFGTESASAESAPEPFSPAVATSITSAYADKPSWEAEFQAVTQLSPTAAEEPAEAEPVKASLTSGLRTSKSERASKRPAEPAPEQPGEQPGQSVAEPADRSEEIMRIGIEMKRLGWSTEQGREYLKRTYGKASRSKLDDAELLDFLHYLEMQSSPLQTQTPF